MTFQLTINTYIQTITLAMIVTSGLYFLSKRLQKNWFTKEKDKKNYESSYKYQKIEESKEKINDKIQKKWRENKEANGILFGCNIYGKPIIKPCESYFRQMFVQGTNGAGKTFMMYNMIELAIRKAMPIVFVDGKGDPKTGKQLKKLADYYGRKFINFSDRGTTAYNPLKSGNSLAIVDRVMTVFSWSTTQPYYEAESKKWLQRVVQLLLDYQLPVDIQHVADYLSLEVVYRLLTSDVQKETQIVRVPKEAQASEEDVTASDVVEYEEKEEVVSVLSERAKEHGKKWFGKEDFSLEDVKEYTKANEELNRVIQGMRSQLEILIESDIGHLFRESEDNLDLKKEIENGSIMLFSLNVNVYSQLVKSMGRFIISNVSYQVSEMFAENEETFQGAVGVFDEFGRYASEKIITILSTARSAKFGSIIGTQSLADLKDGEESLVQQIIDNCNTMLFGRSNDSENADLVSNIVGTYEDIQKTIMTENKGNSLLRLDTKGESGTVREVDKKIFYPNEIKNMNDHEFFVLTKQGNKTKEKCYSRNVFNGLNDN